MTTPTNADYLNLLYLTGGMASATPQGWTVLTPLHLDPAVGLQAQAYVNAAGQIVITIVGPSSSPGLGSLGSLETVSAGASRTDAIIGAGDIPTDYNTALQGFYAQVISAAQERGLSIDSGNIFVAGNSLGGYGAQYLASLNGLGGVSYGGPGNWSLVTLDPRAENFISYVAAGDGIANASSDTGIYSSSSPFPVQYGPRWGQVAIIGDIAQQDHLRILVERAQLAAFNDFIDPNAHMTLGASQFFSAFAGWATLTANSHFIGQYGTLLGTPLPPPSSGDGPSEPSRIGEIINSFFTVRGFVDWIREQSSAAADAIEEYLNISPNELPLPLAWPEIGWDVFGNMVLRLGGEPIFIAPPGAQLALSQENPGAVDLTTSTGTLRLTFS